VVAWLRGRTSSAWRFGAPGGEYTTVLRVTSPGLVVLVLGFVVTGAFVTVGGVVLVVAGAAVTVGGVVLAGGDVPAVPLGTEIAGGGAAVGPAGGSGGTGIVCGAIVVTVVAGRAAVDAGVRRRSERSDDSDPQAAKAAAPAMTIAPTAATANANRREVTGEVCPTGCAARRREGSGECEGGVRHATASTGSPTLIVPPSRISARSPAR
jgi:hypothetical protein